MKKILIILAIVFGLILSTLLILNVSTNLELETEVLFDAPVENVWIVLTDNEKYFEWNPFIISSTGKMKLGARITNVMVNQGSETIFTPIITEYKENEALEWLGSGLGGMFKGTHYFRLTESEDGKTKMLHGEEFSGLLSGLIMRMIANDTQANFGLMNEALKKRVEEINKEELKTHN